MAMRLSLAIAKGLLLFRLVRAFDVESTISITAFANFLTGREWVMLASSTPDVFFSVSLAALIIAVWV